MPDEGKKNVAETGAATEETVKKYKWVYPAVIVLLCLIFAVGIGYGLVTVLQMEGSDPPVVLTDGLTPAPASKEEAADYFNKVLANALAEKPKFSENETFRIDEDSIRTDGGDLLLSTLKYIRSDFEDHLDGTFEKKTAEFFEDASQYLDVPALTAADIEDCTVEYINYVCPSCGEASDTPQDNCGYCGSERAYKKHYKDNYVVTLTLAPDGEAVKDFFPPRDGDRIEALLGDGLKEYAEVGSMIASYDGFTIRFETARATDRLLSLKFAKELSFEGTLNFTGDFSSLGSRTVGAKLTDTRNCGFTWPGISLDQKKLTIAPGDTDNLIATLTCDDPTAYEVQWSSSDESVVSVDDEGYLKASKQTGSTATITASYEFGGKTFTDTCEVSVLNAVESIRLNRRHMKLAPGGTGTLSVIVSPGKATVKTVKWYSENESVAAVDENGVVTAVAPGTAVIYALSDDGYFRSSCEVNVK
ncbi:MAG: Ig-like domain-containing protein [Clostridia bacterium]|nr:Ig-like domain-containing protein [Clostridia bacterium]